MICRYPLMLKNSFSVEAPVYHTSSSAHALTHMNIQAIFMPQDSAGRKSPSGNTVCQLAGVTARYSPASRTHQKQALYTATAPPERSREPLLQKIAYPHWQNRVKSVLAHLLIVYLVTATEPGGYFVCRRAFFLGLRKIAISSEKARGTALHLHCGDNTRGEYRTRM